LRALSERGHRVLFLERDLPWYADNRDLPAPPFCETGIYRDLPELRSRFTERVRNADAVIVGSYVPDGVPVGEWVLDTAHGVTGFYDIDTPVTMRKLREGDRQYLAPELVARYQLYLSFTGGPLLERLARSYHARAARPLYCAVDPALYHPEVAPQRWDLAYLGTYSADRQPALERLLVEPARRQPDGSFAVAGALYPDAIVWPENVERLTHVSPAEHRRFYNAQRYTLNLTRADMFLAGWSPSVRLFEAAACGVPILSDAWPGIEDFFTPGSEILLTRSSDETLALLRDLPDDERRSVGERGRQRVLAAHTAAHRAVTFESYVDEILTGARDFPGSRKERKTSWPRCS
jgi:spore maturation protein CgeB